MIGVGGIRSDRAECEASGVRGVLRDADLAVGGDHQLTAEDRMVELQGLAGVAAEVNVGDADDTHGFSLPWMVVMSRETAVSGAGQTAWPGCRMTLV